MVWYDTVELLQLKVTHAVTLFVLISQKPQIQNNKTSVCVSVVDVI
jgi:hypothetical protein